MSQELELLQSHHHRQPCYMQTRERGQSHVEGEVDPAASGRTSLKARLKEKEKLASLCLSAT